MKPVFYSRQMNLEILIPGKLRASPVQHPATPALITAEKESITVYQHTKHKKAVLF